MVASYHGHRIDLAGLRRRFTLSLKGATLAYLMQVAGRLHLAPRALRLGLDELGRLKTPCILHWDLNHFVVLKSAAGRQAVIHDPAFGVRRMPLAEVSRHFTGIALELAPTAQFRPADERRRVRLRDLTGPVTGLARVARAGARPGARPAVVRRPRPLLHAVGRRRRRRLRRPGPARGPRHGIPPPRRDPGGRGRPAVVGRALPRHDAQPAVALERLLAPAAASRRVVREAPPRRRGLALRRGDHHPAHPHLELRRGRDRRPDGRRDPRDDARLQRRAHGASRSRP